MYLMGIDVGTSRSKAAIFDLSGNMVASVSKEYPMIYSSKGAMELDPNVVWDAVVSCIRRCALKCDIKLVKAIAVSSQGEAIIPVDKSGKVLLNAFVTFDSRNEKEYEWLSGQIERKEVMDITGMPLHPMFSATKILWIRNNHPDVYKNAWKLMCFGDFVSYKLGADSCIDYSLASRTMLFDFRKKEWSDKILSICDIDRDKLPRPVPSGTEIGRISKEFVDEFGFSPDTVIVSGGHDQLCCTLGAGVLNDGVAMSSFGTTESIVCVSKNLINLDDLLDRNIPVYSYPTNDLYAYMTFLTSCTLLLKWYKEKILCDFTENFYREHEERIRKDYAGPTGIYILPYFAGAGTPSMNFKVKGSIQNLTFDVDRYGLYKAFMESVCYEERINISNMERTGIRINELRCIGGGTRSDLWLQLKADINRKIVASIDVSEAGCLGAALLAGKGSGLINNVETAIGDFIRIKKIYYPDEKNGALYDERFNNYVGFVKEALAC